MSLTADTTLVLPATAPFEFSLSASYVAGSAPCTRGRVGRSAELVIGGHAPEPFVASLSPDGPDAVRAYVDWLDLPGDGAAVAARLDAFLSLSDDPTPMYEAARTDEAFARVVDALFGYHHVRFPTPFEAACWAAVSRRGTRPVAAHRRDALVRAIGRVVSVDGAELHAFPTPGAVRGRPADVRVAVGDDRTAATVLAAADAFLETDLRELATDELRTRLESVRGFGPRAAAFVALRGFGRTSVRPTPDARLRAAVADAYGVEDVTADDVRELAAPYGDARGYWAHYLRAWHAPADD